MGVEKQAPMFTARHPLAGTKMYAHKSNGGEFVIFTGYPPLDTVANTSSLQGVLGRDRFVNRGTLPAILPVEQGVDGPYVTIPAFSQGDVYYPQLLVKGTPCEIGTVYCIP
ncbi:hypothetical protein YASMINEVIRUS_373 [Yasminevirus sp. GU-2018]|uniref:Uncharacterized protein n=1 Tax=Yasminevirus sp. GU-2018 TaxID=2420051 RepID=A0A5K0U7Z0_9VIRU|nr:hypothetical protein YASMINEVIRUS_373 [Yasminevirus sp. GU-2018]